MASNATSNKLWLKSSYTDGWRMELTLAHFGDKIALHRYDPLITFFSSRGQAGAGDLAVLCRQLLSDSIMRTMEAQIRNAFLNLPMAFYIGGGTGFSDIESTHLFDPEKAMEVQLNFAYHEVLDPNTPGGLTAIAYASPGQIYSAQKDSNFIDRIKYASEGVRRILRYEMGAYKGLRYQNHPINTLYNCGTITAQAPVSAAITAGDGAPDPETTNVMSSYQVGQRSGSQTHYIQLGTFSTGSIDDLAVGDIISIHTRKSAGASAPYDIAGAPYPTDGTKIERRIVSIDTGNGRISVDEPVMRDYDEEGANDCGAGEYAFVTKGLHIHACVIAATPGAVVGGFAQPPELHFPPAVDDLEALWRMSWDGYYQYGHFRTEAACVVYSAGYVAKAAYLNLGN